MRFLVDAQLPPALVSWLQRKGHDATHALTYGEGRLSDHALHGMALAEDRVLISKDEDFFHLAIRSQGRFRFLWLRLGNCRTHALLNRLESSWPDIESALLDGQSMVEVR